MKKRKGQKPKQTNPAGTYRRRDLVAQQPSEESKKVYRRRDLKGTH